MKDLSVITVTHQSALFIEDQVFSVISGALTSTIEQIIVDNASTDGTPELLDWLVGVKVIKNRENTGFSAANNQAVKFAKGRYFLFLNPDMRVEEGSLDVLVEWMDKHPNVGICSCALVDAKGEKMRNPWPFPRWGREVMSLLRLNQLLGEFQLKEVEVVKGAFLMMRREIVEELGFAFDPRYFLLYEDIDLCREVRRRGYQIAYLDHVKCADFNSRSFSVKPVKWRYQCYSQAMLTYFRKWTPWYQWMVIAMLIPVGRWLRRL